MKSDNDCDLFSANTNGTDITTDITKSDDGNLIQLQIKLHLLNEFFNAVMLQMCSIIQYLLIISRIVPTVKKRRKASKRKRKSYVHRNRRSVFRFIHSRSNDMFRRQFRVA
jgi:hypothetical protein